METVTEMCFGKVTVLNACERAPLSSLACASTPALTHLSAQPSAQPHGLLWPVICVLSGKSLCVLVKFSGGTAVCCLWP